MVARGFGTAAVLLVLVLTLFMIARALGGRQPGDLSTRQQRTAKLASRRDEQRFVARASGVPASPSRARRAHAPEAARSQNRKESE
jgi:phosphate transport system permease protein